MPAKKVGKLPHFIVNRRLPPGKKRTGPCINLTQPADVSTDFIGLVKLLLVGVGVGPLVFRRSSDSDETDDDV
jgi:hypothetical protein